jgi:hypothetical protein
MILRKDIRSLQADELLAFRRAMIVFQAKAGDDSYIDIAGYHGIPRGYCHHDADVFLPWHRMYIWKFESELRKIDNTISLPFWDWTSAASLSEGLAPAHSDPDFTDGGVKANPLATGPIYNSNQNTSRGSSSNLQELASFAGAVGQAFSKSTNFLSFTGRINGPHGSIHVWVGGHMGSPARAAFDPLFWSHHANVDWQWALWQKIHPADPIPDHVLQKTLLGFPGKTVKDMIDYEKDLDYNYEGLDTEAALAASIEKVRALAGSTVPAILVDVKEVDNSGESLMVDIFLKNKVSGQEVFGGAFGIFGMGGMHPPHGVHHHPITSSRLINVTGAMMKLGVPIGDVEVIVRGVTLKGDEVKQNALPIGRVTIKE